MKNNDKMKNNKEDAGAGNDSGDAPELSPEFDLSDKMIRHITMTFLLDGEREWSGGLEELMTWATTICDFIIGEGDGRAMTAEEFDKQYMARCKRCKHWEDGNGMTFCNF